MGTTYSNVNYTNNIQYLVYRNVPSINHKVGIIPMLEKGKINCNIQGYNYLKNHDTNGILFYPIGHNMIPNIQSDEFYCWAIFDNKILEDKYYHLKNGKKIYTDKNINDFTQELYSDTNANLNSDPDSNFKVFVESSSQIKIKPYLKYILVMPHKVPEDLRDFHEGYTYFTIKELRSLVNDKYPDAEFRIIYYPDDLKKIEKELFDNNAIPSTFIKFNSNTSAYGDLDSRHNKTNVIIR